MHHSNAHDEDGTTPRCRHCTANLVPMRFIAVCASRGHAADVPWDRWAHSQPINDDQGRCRDPELTFETRKGGGEGLSSLVVRCLTCEASRHLGDLTARDSLKRISFSCSGRQPWQRGQYTCDARLEVMQRGATNVTIADTTTALDIPEPTLGTRDIATEVRQHRNFEDVRSAPDGPRAPALIGLIADDLGVDDETVRRAMTVDPRATEELRAARAGLLNDEWRAFLQTSETPDERVGTPNFIVSSARLTEAGDADRPVVGLLGDLVDQVVLVHRLREIRVLHGFRRYALDADMVDVDLGRKGRERWLPAVESFGEGVFLSLDRKRLEIWEQKEEVQRRARILELRRRESPIGSRLFEATPRAIMIHTLAHLLMRRLAFSCGYSAASLRERVYAVAGPNPESGLLVYTAAGDAEGTLGGLVRQGEPPRLGRTIIAALEDAAWCSADPLCRESRGQGLGSLNLASCHGCSLAAETSCERSNVLLDRVMVVGDGNTFGFFEPVLKSLRDVTAAHSRTTDRACH